MTRGTGGARRPRRIGRLAVCLTLPLALSGCGEGGTGPGGSGGAGPTEGALPITARAVAAIALDHLSDDTSSRAATYVDETDPVGYVGADLRYGAGAGDDGALVLVDVTPGPRLPSCRATGFVECARLGGGIVLGWTTADEQEGGRVAVWLQRDGATVRALASSLLFTGDPREQEDLVPSVETLRQVVTDDRLAPLVGSGTIAAGESLDDWDGGEREEGELDRVEQTSAGLVGTFLNGRGDAWTYEGPSPVAEDLGDGAVGGRALLEQADGPIGPGVLDVAAVPEMPAWAEPATCREGWSCWAPGDTRVVWRPADGDDPGESWLLQPSPLGGVAAVHVSGQPMPESQRQVRYFSGYVLWGVSSGLLTDPLQPQALGLTTSRDRLAGAEQRASEHPSR